MFGSRKAAMVHNLDVLELGLHYTQTGTPRANKYIKFSTNWTRNHYLTAKNFKSTAIVMGWIY